MIIITFPHEITRREKKVIQLKKLGLHGDYLKNSLPWARVLLEMLSKFAA